jgi:uncharacterized OB-fold protein
MSESPSKPPVFLPFPPSPDRDSQPYWDGLARGELRLQRCDRCRALRWPARAICNRCRSFEHAWEGCDGAAHLVSWIRTHQVFAPALREAVPYIVVQVALDVQPDLLLIGAWSSARQPRVGERLEMDIREGADGYRLPCWRPVEEGSASEREGNDR